MVETAIEIAEMRNSLRSSAVNFAPRKITASAQYTPRMTHPRKNPPWTFAQNRNIGGKAHIQRRYSRMAKVAATRKNEKRNGRSDDIAIGDRSGCDGGGDGPIKAAVRR